MGAPGDYAHHRAGTGRTPRQHPGRARRAGHLSARQVVLGAQDRSRPCPPVPSAPISVTLMGVDHQDPRAMLTSWPSGRVTGGTSGEWDALCAFCTAHAPCSCSAGVTADLSGIAGVSVMVSHIANDARSSPRFRPARLHGSARYAQPCKQPLSSTKIGPTAHELLRSDRRPVGWTPGGVIGDRTVRA